MSTDESEYVAAHVQEALARDPRVNEPELAVTVVKGRIVVHGNVPTEERRRSVTEVVRGCCPDLEVDNRTTVGRFPDAEGMENVR
ncbi:MAG TPA: BON domain-containing protein [Actinomycetota bacterium]|nr:BON domain-containing protein [Actinomycetota bacterium]